MKKYTMDDFKEMVKDFLADNTEEMEDLVIDEYRFVGADEEGEEFMAGGEFVASAHDAKSNYLLLDNGTGNIEIKYLGTI